MKSFTVRGYFPEDGEHLLIDRVEYVAHVSDRPEEEVHKGRCENCEKCDFGMGRDFITCPVWQNHDIICLTDNPRKLQARFEKVGKQPMDSWRDGVPVEDGWYAVVLRGEEEVFGSTVRVKDGRVYVLDSDRRLFPFYRADMIVLHQSLEVPVSRI
jgi:hypothetical protein